MDACEVTFLLNEGDGKITELQEGVWKGAERTLQKWSRSHDAGAVYHVFSCFFFPPPPGSGFLQTRRLRHIFPGKRRDFLKTIKQM